VSIGKVGRCGRAHRVKRFQRSLGTVVRASTKTYEMSRWKASYVGGPTLTDNYVVKRGRRAAWWWRCIVEFTEAATGPCHLCAATAVDRHHPTSLNVRHWVMTIVLKQTQTTTSHLLYTTALSLACISCKNYNRSLMQCKTEISTEVIC